MSGRGGDATSLPMPGYKTHVVGAVAVTAVAVAGVWWLGVYRPSLETIACMGIFAVLGGLFPDVDTNSKGQHLFYGAAIVVDAYLIFREHYRYAAVLGFFSMLPAVSPHRGWTHTWWAALLVPVGVLLGPMFLLGMPWQPFVPFYLATVLGYFSHLMLDRVL